MESERVFTICKLQRYESKAIQHILDKLGLVNEQISMGRMLNIIYEDSVFLPDYEHTDAARELLEIMHYVRGTLENGTIVKYYLPNNIKDSLNSAKNILVADKYPNLCYLLNSHKPLISALKPKEE